MSIKLRPSKDPALLEKIQALTKLPDTIVGSGLNPTEWTDKNFDPFLKAAQPSFTKRGDLQSMAASATRYIEAYLGLASIAQDDHSALLFSLMANIKVEKDYPFNAGQKDPVTLQPSTIDAKQYKFPDGGTQWNAANVTMNLEDVEDFYKAILKMKDTAEDQQRVINIAGFLTLNMLRSIRKDVTSLYSHIPINAYVSYQNLFNDEFPNRFPPPSAHYCSWLSAQIPSGGQTAKNLLAFCVDAWVTVQKGKKLNKSLCTAVLKAGCLLSLAENGLGAIAWTIKAHKALKVQPNDYFCALMLDDNLEEQVLSIANFIMGPGTEHTWPFCRIFEESALCNFSNNGCPDVATVSAIIAMEDSEKVMEMPQFKNLTSMIQAMVPLALAIKEELRPSVPTSAVTASAGRILQNARKYQKFTVYKVGDARASARTTRALVPHAQRIRTEDHNSEESSDEDDSDESSDEGLVLG